MTEPTQTPGHFRITTHEGEVLNVPADALTNEAAVVEAPVPPPVKRRINTNDLNDFEKEQACIEELAYMQITCLEMAAAFKHLVETLGFSDTVQDEFDKRLRKCLNTLESQVPNAYRLRVMKKMTVAMKEADDAQEAGLTAEQVLAAEQEGDPVAEPTDPTTTG